MSLSLIFFPLDQLFNFLFVEMSKRKSKCGLHEEENTDKRGGGVYKPALSGFPQYMLSMLSDTDRNKQYEKAISKCVSDFIESVGRQPVVADMGCGTGLLTLISLASGAKFVIAVDTNSDMVDITERVTKNWQNVEVFHGTFESYTNKKNISEPFIDILVRVILAVYFVFDNAVGVRDFRDFAYKRRNALVYFRRIPIP